MRNRWIVERERGRCTLASELRVSGAHAAYVRFPPKPVISLRWPSDAVGPSRSPNHRLAEAGLEPRPGLLPTGLAPEPLGSADLFPAR